jgi:hypothetical protein
MTADGSAAETGNEAIQAFYLEDEDLFLDLNRLQTAKSRTSAPSDEDDEEKQGHRESWHAFQTP